MEGVGKGVCPGKAPQGPALLQNLNLHIVVQRDLAQRRGPQAQG